MEACYENRSDIRALVQKIVPTYQPQDAQVQALDIQMQDVQVQSQAPDAFPKSAIQEAILSKIAAQEAAFPKAAVRETGLRRSAPHGKIVDKYEKKEKYEKKSKTIKLNFNHWTCFKSSLCKSSSKNRKHLF